MKNREVNFHVTKIPIAYNTLTDINSPKGQNIASLKFDITKLH